MTGNFREGNRDIGANKKTLDSAFKKAVTPPFLYLRYFQLPHAATNALSLAH